MKIDDIVCVFQSGIQVFLILVDAVRLTKMREIRLQIVIEREVDLGLNSESKLLLCSQEFDRKIAENIVKIEDLL